MEIVKALPGVSTPVVLLCLLGVVLFLVLLVVLIIFVVQRRELKVLLPFFLLPIVMIGWPTIQSIKFGSDIEVTKTAADQIRSGQATPDQVAEVEKKVGELEARSNVTTEQKMVLVNARESIRKYRFDRALAAATEAGVPTESLASIITSATTLARTPEERAAVHDVAIRVQEKVLAAADSVLRHVETTTGHLAPEDPARAIMATRLDSLNMVLNQVDALPKTPEQREKSDLMRLRNARLKSQIH